MRGAENDFGFGEASLCGKTKSEMALLRRRRHRGRIYSRLRQRLEEIASLGIESRSVVVDHESCREPAAHVTARFPWVDLIARSTNAGFAAGVNLAARATRSPFLLLVNPDCVVTEAMCDRLLAVLTARRDVAVAGPRIRNADGTIQPSARRFPDLTTAIAGRSSWLTRVLPRR